MSRTFTTGLYTLIIVAEFFIEVATVSCLSVLLNAETDNSILPGSDIFTQKEFGVNGVNLVDVSDRCEVQ